MIRAVCLIVAAASLFSQCTLPAHAGSAIDSGRAATSVSVQISMSGQVFVPVHINGSRELWFVLDTAAPTSIDPSLIKELALPAETGYRGRGTGSGTVDILRIPSAILNIGEHRLSIPIFGTPVKQLEPYVGREWDGILGAELFGESAVTIDYRNQKLVIGAPCASESERRPVEVSQTFPYVSATLEIDGRRIPGRFLLDTGANTTVDVYKAFAESARIKPTSDAKLASMGLGGGSSLAASVADSIQLGPFSLKDVPVYLPDATEGLMAAQDYAGIIGTEILQRFVPTVDLPHKVLCLSPLSVNRSFKKRKSGLSLQSDPTDFSKLFVSSVDPNSPAERAGFAKGDIVLSIDGKSKWTLDSFRRYFNVQTKADVEVQRKSGMKRLRLLLDE